MINRLILSLKSITQLVKTGILLLSMSASVINQIQERGAYRLMPRTKERPLVSGTISLPASVVIAVFTAVSGFGMLWYFFGILPALMGLFNLAWYNVVYTPLKYKTALAAVPGGIVGAVPP